MKNTIISRRSIGAGEVQVVVELQPDTTAEATAITNVGNHEADETERELVENYLLFGLTGLGNYSLARIVRQQGHRVTVVVHLNRGAASSFG